MKQFLYRMTHLNAFQAFLFNLTGTVLVVLGNSSFVFHKDEMTGEFALTMGGIALCLYVFALINYINLEKVKQETK